MSLARLAAPILRWPFRQRWLAQRLFGVPLAPLEPDDHYFDLVTPFLVAEATRRIPRGATVVDLGCGPFAVVGRALASRCEARVVCADVNPQLIERARAAVAAADPRIQVRESRYLDGVADVAADFVCFNPPYVPERVGEHFALPEARSSQWRAGDDGFAIADGFLDALAAWPRPLVGLLAVNRWFVPATRVRKAVAERSGLELERVVRARLLPADVHVLRREPSS